MKKYLYFGSIAYIFGIILTPSLGKTQDIIGASGIAIVIIGVYSMGVYFGYMDAKEVK